MLFALNPQKVAVDSARAMALLALLARAVESVLYLKQLVHQHKRMKLCSNLSNGVYHGRSNAVCRLGLVGMADRNNAGQRNLVDELRCACQVTHTVAHVGSKRHKSLARIALGHGPVSVDGLSSSCNIVNAQNTGTVGDCSNANCMRSCVALSGLSYSRNSANKALSRHSAEQRISHRNHRTSSSLNYNVLVRKLVKAWTWVNADAVLGNASTHKTASLIAQKAHDLAHDRRLFRQGKTALRAQRACLGSCGCGSSSCATSKARRAHVVQLHLLALNTSSKAVLIPVHYNAAAVRLRSYSNHFWIGEASDVVDDGGSKADAHLCYLGVARINGDNCAGSYQRAYHRHYTLSLFCRQNRRVTWTSRLSPNVNDVSAFIQHL